MLILTFLGHKTTPTSRKTTGKANRITSTCRAYGSITISSDVYVLQILFSTEFTTWQGVSILKSSTTEAHYRHRRSTETPERTNINPPRCSEARNYRSADPPPFALGRARTRHLYAQQGNRARPRERMLGHRNLLDHRGETRAILAQVRTSVRAPGCWIRERGYRKHSCASNQVFPEYVEEGSQSASRP